MGSAEEPAIAARAGAGASGRPGAPRLILGALRLVARTELPGVHKLLRRAGVWDQSRWTGAPRRETRGRWHRYRMSLDLSDFHQRGAYLYGRLLDHSVQAFMLSVLGRGDDFIDFGANIGILSMTGSRAVGNEGRVLAVEPNPDVYKQLQHHIEQNAISNVRTVCAAASNREGAMTLSVPPTGNTGAGTLGRLPSRYGDRTAATYEVPLRVSDDLVNEAWGSNNDHRHLFVKIDVEGHETALLRGLCQTIAVRRPVILSEVNPSMLSTNGSSVEELIELMRGWGYRAFGIAARPPRMLRPPPPARIVPLADSWRTTTTCNVAFLPELDRVPFHVASLITGRQ